MFESGSEGPRGGFNFKSGRGSAGESGQNPGEKPAASPGGFGLRILIQAGLGPIIDDLQSGVPLGPGQFELLSAIDFPLLAKLVEYTAPADKTVRVRPVVFSALAEAIERDGLEQAVHTAAAHVGEIDRTVSWSGGISLAIDRWHGRFEFRELFQALDQLCRGNYQNQYCVLGPSTADLAQLGSTAGQLESVLAELKRLKIEAIEGGDDFSIHRQAANAGLASVIGQEIGIGARAEACDLAREDQRRQFFDQLYLKFAEVNSFRAAGGVVETWFPRLPNGFDRGPSSAAGSELSILGLDLCRIFMLARLMLPAVRFIRAPLAKIGPRLAATAIAFGANDLGFAAFDPLSAANLGVLEISKIEDIFPEERVFSKLL